MDNRLPAGRHIDRVPDRCEIVLALRVHELHDGISRLEREQHVHPVAVLTDHAPNSVQRVSWNITGALLSSSDKRGNLKLWQCSPGESFSEWHCVGSVASNNAGDGEHGVTPVRTDPLSSAVG